MSRYALILVENGYVENVFEWDGNTSEWQPPEGYISIESNNVKIGGSYINEVFIDPDVPLVVPPTKEEILTVNTTRQKYLLDEASLAMTPLLLSLQLGEASEEETNLAKKWQMYYKELQLVDLTKVLDWPLPPLN